MENELAYKTEDGFSIYKMENGRFFISAPDGWITSMLYSSFEKALNELDDERKSYEYRLDRLQWKVIEERHPKGYEPQFIMFSPKKNKFFEGMKTFDGYIDLQWEEWGNHYWDTLEEARRALDEWERNIS